MQRRYGLSILLTALVILAGVYVAVSGMRQSRFKGLPFSVHVVDAQTAIVQPLPRLPLPPGLRAGDNIDLTALPPASRIAIDLPLNLATLPPGHTYNVTVRRDGAHFAIPITSVGRNAVAASLILPLAGLCFTVLLSAIALLAVWRGRDRAAAGLVLWAVAFLIGMAANAVPSDGMPGLGLMLGANILFLLARVGFYVMAESMAGGALNSHARAWWRAGFLLLLALGAIESLGGPLAFVVAGWAEPLRPAYGLVLSASYLIPVALLLVSYRDAEVTQRLRLRWMVGSGAVFFAGIIMNNTPILGFPASLIVWQSMFAIAAAGFLYAILRHRVVDVAVVLNHALVYTATTSLVLGLFALLESLIERAALGHDASLLLELAVPLGLGASLSTVHRRIDSTVERLVFRRQYREEVALRGFAKECAFVTDPAKLLDLTVDQIHLHVGAPWVALYESAAVDYVLARQRGNRDLPTQVDIDDLALVKLRTHDTEVALHDTPSLLGPDGHAFPLRARGSLLGVLVVGPRPGEHYAADERELMAHVAHEVGAALSALRAQAREALLNEARAQAQASEERARASEALLLKMLPALGSTAGP
ncbi:MAG: hypothetical protein KGJ94_05315 [Xanthomonadaceae bacterium]|nr:hypothetical protein [Xanthomonadaceae bacterium]